MIYNKCKQSKHPAIGTLLKYGVHIQQNTKKRFKEQSRHRWIDLESHHECWFLTHTTMSQDGATCQAPKCYFRSHLEARFQATAREGLAGVSGVALLRTAQGEPVCSQLVQQK